MDSAQDTVITVFGSSRSATSETDYLEAQLLGRLLAGAGFTICSGGYSGSMEAVSRGAQEAGGRTIGVTVKAITRSGNAWLDEEVRAETIFHRIERMVTIASGFVALRGGVGTLAEICLTLNLLYLRALEPRPLVLIGHDWRSLMDHFFGRLHASKDERSLLTFADTPASALEALKQKLFKKQSRLPF